MIVDFNDLRLNDESPIYLQIIRYIKMGIIAGAFIDGDELPSRRVLSSMLSVNPNTIQKAFHQLENEAILVSYAGSKSLLTLTQEKVSFIREELIMSETKRYLNAVSSMGLSLQETKEKVEEFWNKESGQ